MAEPTPRDAFAEQMTVYLRKARPDIEVDEQAIKMVVNDSDLLELLVTLSSHNGKTDMNNAKFIAGLVCCYDYCCKRKASN